MNKEKLNSDEPTDQKTAGVSLICSGIAIALLCIPGFDPFSGWGAAVMFFLVAFAFSLAAISYWGDRCKRALWALLLSAGLCIAPVIMCLYLLSHIN
jgi:hypothetical protein